MKGRDEGEANPPNKLLHRKTQADDVLKFWLLKPMRSLCFLLFVGIILITAPKRAGSQVFECNGIWTNQPCLEPRPQKRATDISVRVKTRHAPAVSQEEKPFTVIKESRPLSPESRYALWRLSAESSRKKTGQQKDFTTALENTTALCSETAPSNDICLYGLGVFLQAWGEE
jgi:hypothetical protein